MGEMGTFKVSKGMKNDSVIVCMEMYQQSEMYDIGEAEDRYQSHAFQQPRESPTQVTSGWICIRQKCFSQVFCITRHQGKVYGHKSWHGGGLWWQGLQKSSSDDFHFSVKQDSRSSAETGRGRWWFEDEKQELMHEKAEQRDLRNTFDFQAPQMGHLRLRILNVKSGW